MKNFLNPAEFLTKNILRNTIISIKEHLLKQVIMKDKIEYDLDEGTNGYQMIKNEDGVWQVSYLPLQ